MADNIPPPDGFEAAHPFLPSALSSNPKEAYFQLLRVWVQQASLAHNASTCFPYYLMANYPQMYAATTGLMPFPMESVPQVQGAAAPLAGGPAVEGNQQLRMSLNRLLDNPARNAESKMEL